MQQATKHMILASLTLGDDFGFDRGRLSLGCTSEVTSRKPLQTITGKEENYALAA